MIREYERRGMNRGGVNNNIHMQRDTILHRGGEEGLTPTIPPRGGEGGGTPPHPIH